MAKLGISKNKKIAIGAVAVVAVMAVAAFFLYGQNIKNMKSIVDVDTIYNGISIDETNVGGLSTEEARELLLEEMQKSLNTKNIEIEHKGNKWDLKYSDFDAKFDIDAAVNEAYAVGREGSLRERYNIIKSLEETKKVVVCPYNYDVEKAKTLIKNVAEELNVEAVDSSMTRKNGKFEISNEQMGYMIDVENTYEKFLTMIDDKKEGTLEPVVNEIKPLLTKEENEKATTLIGTFYTTFSSGVAGRNENLRVGSLNIDGTILKPGDIFSMNKELGPQTYESGYRDAAVIVNGKLEDGLAGGVCQITTTLYNAVILAELEVVERRNHSLMVGYVPLGRDAAIAGDYTDFKFKNNTEFPVYVEAYLSGNKLITNVYGNEIHDAGRTVEFEKVFLETISKPAEKITKSSDIFEGERKITYNGKTGAKVSTYKKIYQNGTLLSREWFSNSTYKATADEVTVGTKAKDAGAAIIPPVEDSTKAVNGTPTTETEISDSVPMGS